jgi:DNA damage-binding protein 1
LSDKKSEASHGFIDGDLIETFLELDRATLEELCIGLTKETNGEKIPLELDDVMKIVEDLSRIH